jgi:phosphatidylserine/phosphatidylglycerophosphate/cardiolipin synthase-like enzyme
MRKLKTITFSLILVLGVLIGTRVFSPYATEGQGLSPKGTVPATVTVEDLSGDKYFPAVKEALQNAEKSIYMAMYFVGFNPNDKGSHIYELVKELVDAYKRGVKVKVTLDQGIDFSAGERRQARWVIEQRNASLFIYLKEQGIEVYYDSLSTITHAKAIVIDEETVIVGSANWSESSLQKNWETSCLIKSKELAQQFLKYFSQISIDHEVSDFDEEKRSGVHLAPVFLKDPALAARMLRTFDETAFDLYLFLLKNYNGNPEGKVDIDYKNLTSNLGLDKKFSFVSSRDILVRTLARLDKKYQLVIRKKQPPIRPLWYY